MTDTPDAAPAPTSERLNKHLALHLGISRRQADDLIEKGKVLINGKPVILGVRVEPGDDVTVSGTPVAKQTAYRYVLLHKPVGYVSSRKQQGTSPTIYDLVPASFRDLKPVGRLDRESSGILLLLVSTRFTGIYREQKQVMLRLLNDRV